MLVLASAAAEGERNPSRSVLDDAGLADYYNLDYDQALQIFRGEIAARPAPDACNHLAQALVFRAMFRAGVLDSGKILNARTVFEMPKVPMTAADQAEFNAATQHAISLAQARTQQNPNDTAALYSMGVTHGLIANYDAVVHKQYFDALRESTAARRLDSRVIAIDPNFVDARLTQGLNDYIVGTLPLAWKMLSLLGGYHGDRQRGIQTLELVAGHGSMNRIDAQVMLTAIYRREKMPDRSIALLNDLIARLPRNYLLRFELAEMYGDLGQSARALEVVNQVEQMKLTHAPGYDRIPDDQLRALRERVAKHK
jgi:tetratricopeptide (TPR) repeat protein